MKNEPKKSKKKRSPELQTRINKTRADAHNEIVSAGKIQFRLDAETMELLLRTADERGTGAGVLARMWVIERLKSEASGTHEKIQEIDRRLKLIENQIEHNAS